MKPRHIAAAVLLTFLPLTTVSMPAFTQEDPLTLQARARFKEGVDAFDKGKYEEARLAFLQAYTLKKHPAVLLNLAQSSAKSNHNLDAAKYFQQFLKEATTATPQQRKDAESGLAEVRQKLGRIEVVAPPGTDISLDDQGKVGTTPMDVIEVEPGQHTVKSPTQSATVIAVVGQKVEAKLGPATSSSSLPPGPTVVTPVPSTPAAPQETPPPEKPTEDGTVHTRSKSLFAPPENTVPVWIGVGVAGAGLIGFAAFGIFRNDAQSKADAVEAKIVKAAHDRNIPERGACSNASVQATFASPCATLKKNNDLVDTNATVANISLGIGIAGGLFAAGWYLFAPKREEGPSQTTGRAPTRSVFMPYANYDGGGFSFASEF